MIRFACPKCRKVYQADSEQAGRQTECKSCGSLLLIPAEESGDPAAERTASPPDPSVPNGKRPDKQSHPQPAATAQRKTRASADEDDEADAVPIRTRRQGSGVPARGLLLIGVLLVALTIAVVVAIQRQSSPAREPSATPDPTSQLQERASPDVLEAQRLAAESRGTFVTAVYSAMLCYFAGIMLYLVASILFSIWVIRDCRKRGVKYDVVWLSIVFPLNLIGFAIYLGSRPDGTLRDCAHCGNPKLSYLVICPHCRFDFQREEQFLRHTS